MREDGKLPATLQGWLAGADELPGSWWDDWSEWLKGHAGKQIAAPRITAGARNSRPSSPHRGVTSSKRPDQFIRPAQGAAGHYFREDSHGRHRHRFRRTHPVGRVWRHTAKTAATDLGAIVIKEALARARWGWIRWARSSWARCWRPAAARTRRARR